MIKAQISYIILFLLFFTSCSSEKSGWDQYLYSADVSSCGPITQA